MNLPSAACHDLIQEQINDPKKTIINATQRRFDQLETSEKVVRKNLLQSLVNYFNEAGLQVQGSLHWLLVCFNGLFTYLFVHVHQGTKALEDAAMSILPGFKGWAVHDCWGRCLNVLIASMPCEVRTSRGNHWPWKKKASFGALIQEVPAGLVPCIRTRQGSTWI